MDAPKEQQSAAAAATPTAPAKKEEVEKPHPSGLSLDQRFALCRSVGEECIQEDELRRLLNNKPIPVCYDGFEPSGRMHIAQGIMKAINVNKLTRAGCQFIFWVADWFALMNDKMGGDIKKIQLIGRHMIEIWKACGMDMTNVKFLWSSEEINARPSEYWMTVIDIARKNNLSRITRCCQIMGRKESDSLSAAQIMYPCMQCADIFFLKADICQLGMDQRKVNVLAREYCDSIGKKLKPIILSHVMLPGLKEGQEKMAKSDPSSAIFMDDTESEVNTKIKACFCPPSVIEKNPVVAYIEHIIFPASGSFAITRSAENGGDVSFTDVKSFKDAYASGNLHPGDVKPALARALNKLLQPVRDHFANNPEAAKLNKQVKDAVAQEQKRKEDAAKKAKAAEDAAASESKEQKSDP